ncbi:hypothetical protein Mag101_16105 [Microbulbifer agarilyticus]|uniref:Uncharacterized protein n=1 Tax=Microbulbifer agarilyticus TaxID=260552 RepID=A0A1Q2M8H6_9GAMM|nr:hypothetical protein Mag101_16105 [Microbulbifer agarilyticus]
MAGSVWFFALLVELCSGFSGGRVAEASFQERCEPIPGRFVANFLFATILKTRLRYPAFNLGFCTA